MIVALLSFVGSKGVFLYYLFFRTRELFSALTHPAARFAAHPIGHWSWRTFVGLILLGGLGFSIPAFVLLNSRERS